MAPTLRDLVRNAASSHTVFNTWNFPYPAPSVRREIQALRRGGIDIRSNGDGDFICPAPVQFTQAEPQAAV